MPRGSTPEGNSQRERLNQHKRTREEPELRTEAKSSTVNLEIANYKKLAELRHRYPDRLRLRAPANAVKITLRQQAAGAARLRRKQHPVTVRCSQGGTRACAGARGRN